jgi:hypothetical protein
MAVKHNEYHAGGGSGPGTLDWTVRTAEYEELSHEVATFAVFVAQILADYRASLPSLAGLAVVNTTLPATPLPAAEVAALPYPTYGTSVSITGTVRQINDILRNVIYYANVGVYGQATLTVTATDRPFPCSLPAAVGPVVSASAVAAGIANNPRVFFQPPPAVHPVLLPPPDAAGPPAQTLCDLMSQVSNTVSASIPIYVQQVNQPPSVALAVANVTAPVDTVTLLPQVTLVDLDHVYSPPIYDATGKLEVPPISVTVTVVNGTVGFGTLSGLGVPQGSGTMDSIVSVNGPMDLVNAALASIVYLCASTTPGCVKGYTDTITVACNDEGFTGLGGPLTATNNITVQLVGDPIQVTVVTAMSRNYTCPAKNWK